MNTTKKLICILITGAAFSAAAPVFADSFHGRGYDRDHHSVQNRDYGRHDYRDYDRRAYRDYDRHHVVVVERPYVVERPVYYEQAPAANSGIGSIIGAAIGTIFDNQNQQ